MVSAIPPQSHVPNERPEQPYFPQIDGASRVVNNIVCQMNKALTYMYPHYREKLPEILIDIGMELLNAPDQCIITMGHTLVDVSQTLLKDPSPEVLTEVNAELKDLYGMLQNI